MLGSLLGIQAVECKNLAILETVGDVMLEKKITFGEACPIRFRGENIVARKTSDPNLLLIRGRLYEKNYVELNAEVPLESISIEATFTLTMNEEHPDFAVLKEAVSSKGEARKELETELEKMQDDFIGDVNGLKMNNVKILNIKVM